MHFTSILLKCYNALLIYKLKCAQLKVYMLENLQISYFKKNQRLKLP